MHGGGSLGDYLKLLRTPTLLLMILAQAFAVIILVPLIHYGPQFFEDYRNMGGKEARWHSASWRDHRRLCRQPRIRVCRRSPVPADAPRLCDPGSAQLPGGRALPVHWLFR